MRGAAHARGAALQAGEDRESNVRSHAKAYPVGSTVNHYGAFLGAKTQPVRAVNGLVFASVS